MLITKMYFKVLHTQISARIFRIYFKISLSKTLKRQLYDSMDLKKEDSVKDSEYMFNRVTFY